MAHVAETRKLFVGAYDISSSVREMAFAQTTDELDATVFGDDTRKMYPGLKGAALSAEGFFAAGASGIETILAGYERTVDVPITLTAVDGAVGAVARSFLATRTNLVVGAQVGELLPVSVEAVASHRDIIRGELLVYTTATADVTGTAVELGAVTATESVFARLHVFGGGTAMAVIVQSDSTATMGTPANIVTFTPLATTVAATYEAMTSTATNADTFWRITATGAAGRSFAVFVGIQQKR